MEPSRLHNAVQGAWLFPIVHDCVKKATGRNTSMCAICCAMAVRSSASMNGNSGRRKRVSLGRWLMVNKNDTISALGKVSEVRSNLINGER